MTLTPDLMDKLRAVELPTLGHTLDEGFVDAAIAPIAESPRLVGVARTLDLRVPDAYAVNHALLHTNPGEVLVISVAGGAHAPVGAVTAAAAIARGLAGIVVDGPVTDAPALRESRDRLAVYATGYTARTTKRTGTLGRDSFDAEVCIGGVCVAAGDLVLGDEHGILVLPQGNIDPAILNAALAADTAEPDLLARIESGVPLGTLLPTAP